MLANLSVSLWRGAKEGRYKTYSVPQRESQTVLDVVTFVQRNIDPAQLYASTKSATLRRYCETDDKTEEVI